MASTECEHIMGFWGGAPSGVQEQSHWSGITGKADEAETLFSFWTSNGSGKFALSAFCKFSVYWGVKHIMWTWYLENAGHYGCTALDQIDMCRDQPNSWFHGCDICL